MSTHRVLLACLLWGWGASAFALNPALDVGQYAHAGWSRREGFTVGVINAIAQTQDGYLWLGTDFGLLRFDGVRATPWQPPDGQRLPTNEVMALRATRDGGLWIGTSKGLVRWKANTLTEYPEMAGRNVVRLLEDREGVLWAAVLGLPTGGLCSVNASTVTCHTSDPRFGYGVWGLFEDSQRNLWVAVSNGFWRWKPGTPDFIPVPGAGDSLRAFEEYDGRLHGSTSFGMRELRDGALHPSRLPKLPSTHIETMLRDRDGGLWIGTDDQGLVHVHDGRIDSFSVASGLTSSAVRAIIEDREGNVWVATQNGLDRFSESSVSTVSAAQGLAGSAFSVLADGPDTVWLGTNRGLQRSRRGQLSVVAADPRRPGSTFGGLLLDRSGRLWAATLDGIGYLQGGRFTAIPGPPGIVRQFLQQPPGTVWAASQTAGLLELDAKRIVRQIPWSSFGRKDFATALAADPAGTGLWLGFYEGGIAYFDGQVRRSYGEKDGLDGSRINQLRFDEDGALWVAAQGGLSRLHDGRLTPLRRLEGLACDPVHWTIRDDSRALWLHTACGLARVPSDEVAAWIAASSGGPSPAHAALVTILDSSDGVTPELLASGLHPLVARAGDGRLWFSANNGVHIVDPNHLAFNRVAPPVYVERVVANHVVHEVATSSTTTTLRLPALVRDLVIDYTALSLVAPAKMRFRYKLEGWDRDWQDVGTRRQAFYTSLPPRSYRFRVMASNNSGVWNETGAAVDFVIPPAYYQTAWFWTLSVGLVLAGIWGAHRIRLRIVETHEREISALNERLMRAQEQERSRIAGELHDGVAQEMLAITMMVGTAKRRVSDDSPAKLTLDKIQDKLIQVGTDIRQISHDLHPPALQEAGLPEAVRSYCAQFSASSGIAVPCEADEAARDLSRGAALALYRVVQEALGNAAKHAQATRILVRLSRANGDVSLTVSDDGVGFDRNQLGVSEGLGLITMRERAGQLGGRFEVDSAPGRGTTIRVDIPFR